MNPRVEAFFDEATFTITYVVSDPDEGNCAVIDSVLDYDPKSGRTETGSADRVIEFVRNDVVAFADEDGDSARICVKTR